MGDRGPASDAGGQTPGNGGGVSSSRGVRREAASGAALASRQQLPAWARAATPASAGAGGGRDRRGSGAAAGVGLSRKDSGVRGRMVIGGAGGGGGQMGPRRSSRGE